MSEDTELLSRISQLAGHINLHKSHPQESTGNNHPYTHHHLNKAQRQPQDRTRAHIGRIPMNPHRHRSLVLNRKSNDQALQEQHHASSTIGDSSRQGSELVANIPNVQWISKRGRHVQLISSATYNKEAKLRVEAIKQTRQQRESQRQLRGRRKLNASLHSDTMSAHYITINGLRYQVCNNGSKLIRQKDPDLSAKSTPKTALIGGVTFLRSKRGNLYRVDLVRDRGPAAKLLESCKQFTVTGRCSKGPRCLYVHNPRQVAICREYLQSGKCVTGLHCDLSHDPTYERVPACLHFLRGNCSKTDCRYPHVRVNPGAQVCKAFASLGYCNNGTQCQERHAFECPDYANTGQCGNKDCHLPHVDRAGQLRRHALHSRKDLGETESPYDTDVSSDSGDTSQANTNDIDSDDLDDLDEEMILRDDSADQDPSRQTDFIHF